MTEDTRICNEVAKTANIIIEAMEINGVEVATGITAMVEIIRKMPASMTAEGRKAVTNKIIRVLKK